MSAEAMTYEGAVERLEEIIRRLDSNQAGLRETLELCQEGKGLIELAVGELDAVGHGLLWLDDCLPNCAQGKFHSTPVTAYALSPKQNRFRRLTLKYTYKGKHYTDRRRIHYFRGIGGSPGYWAYDIVG